MNPVRHHAVRHGGQPAVICGEKILSYGQLDSAVVSAAGRIAGLGVQEGERVAIVGVNSIEYVIALFALWRIKAIACLASTRLPEESLRKSLTEIRCSRVLNLHEICQLETSVPFIPGYTEYTVNDPADIMFTSGTSGGPKAAVHTFGNHYFNAVGANERIPVGPGDRWLLSLPLYHVGGLGIVFRTLVGGGTVVIPESGEDIARAIQRRNVTQASFVPTQLSRLLATPANVGILRKLKAILIGGSPVPDALIRRGVDAELPVYLTYGLTETASQVATSDRLTKKNPLPRACILRNARVRISDDREILVKGKTLFQGYLHGEDIVLPLDKDGWFHTGDLGCVHEDRTLTVLGRKDNMFISGGENIQPEEIERYLCQIEGILQAVVVPVKNKEFGARPVAFIQTKEGMRLSGTEILSSLREYLPSFKLPDQIYPWPSGVPERGMKSDRPYFIRLAQTQTPAPTVLP